MKVDLDALEATAKKANKRDGADWWIEEEVSTSVEGTRRVWVEIRDCKHIDANSPDVTLALVARIRELETGLIEASNAIVGWVMTESQCERFRDDRDWETQRRLRALAEKGTTR